MIIEGRCVYGIEINQQVLVYSMDGKEIPTSKEEYLKWEQAWRKVWEVMDKDPVVVSIYRRCVLVDPTLIYLLVGKGAYERYALGELYRWINGHDRPVKMANFKTNFREGTEPLMLGLNDVYKYL